MYIYVYVCVYTVYKHTHIIKGIYNFCSDFFLSILCSHLLWSVRISPHCQLLPPWNTHFPWLLCHHFLLIFLWFTSHLFLVSFVNIASFIWPSNIWTLQSSCLSLRLSLCIHVFGDFTHCRDFKYGWHADVSHVSISNTNFFKIHVHRSGCPLDPSTWTFPRPLKPNRSAQSPWLPYLVPPVLPISENGGTLQQWLNPKTEESSFMPPLPLPLKANPSPSPASCTLQLKNWIDRLLYISVVPPWA